LIFGEDRQSDYFVVTNLQDKKIDKFNIFKKIYIFILREFLKSN